MNTQEEQLDRMLDNYINNLSNLFSEQHTQPSKHTSYHAMLRIDSSYENENGEKKRQDKLIAKSERIGYEHVLGYDRKNPKKISFCQFSTVGYDINDDKANVEKLYINCERDKVAKISKEFMKASRKAGVNITFKIAYEDGFSDNYRRSDKIVIYTESEPQKESVVDILKTIASKHKDLFREDKTIPFMPKVKGANFISTSGIQKAGRYDTFKGLSKISRPITNTWNSKMSEVLLESLVFGVDIAKRKCHVPFDPNNPESKLPEDCLEDCVSEYLKMSEKEKAQVKKLMQSMMFDLCEKNELILEALPPKAKDTLHHALEAQVFPPEKTSDTPERSTKSIQKNLENR